MNGSTTGGRKRDGIGNASTGHIGVDAIPGRS